MKSSTEQLIHDIFAILAFVTIFILRVLVGSIKLAIYIYSTIQERSAIQESELVTIATPITEALTSQDAIDARVKTVRVIKTVAQTVWRATVFIYRNAPTFYQEFIGFCDYLASNIRNRFAPRAKLLSITASIEEVRFV